MIAKTQTPPDILGAELDEFIQSQMQQHHIPGLAACIVKGEQVVWKAAYGMANIETNRPVTLQTEFTLASISKLFTATACAQLWEDGSLDLDADINDYLPIVIKNPNFPNTPITTRQLLQHKSSLHDFESDLQLWDAIGDPIYDLPTFCAAYFVAGGELYVPANFGTTAPGASSYWYSNAGFTLLGYIVEVVSGMPFDDYCKEHIFNPLQMNTAAWFYEDLDITDMAMPYRSDGTAYGYYSVPEYPAAMLKANVEELAHFLIAYTQRGLFEGQELVNENTFETIVPNDLMNGFGWWGRDTWWGDSSGDFWSHGGFMNGVRTQLNYYPDDSTGLIILTNGEGSYSAIQNKLEEYIPLFEIEGSTSVSEKENTKLHLFPNPVGAERLLHFHVKPNNSFFKKIEMYTIDGQLLQEWISRDTDFSLHLPDYPNGLYIFRIVSNGDMGTFRVFLGRE